MLVNLMASHKSSSGRSHECFDRQKSWIVSAFIAATAFIPFQISAEIANWEAAVLSGSDRLAIHSIVSHSDRPSRATFERLLWRNGYFHLGDQPQYLEWSGNIRPVLTYTRNFNGGVSADTVELGGLTYRFDEESRASSGIVVGGQANASRKWSIDPFSTATISGFFKAEGLPSEDQWRLIGFGSVSVEKYVADSLWIDSMFGLTAIERDTDDDEVIRQASVGPTYTYSAGETDQQISLSWTIKDRAEYSQTGLDLDWLGAVKNVGAVSLGAEFNKTIHGQNTVLRGINVGLTRPIAKRIVAFRASYRETGGRDTFGVTRVDRIREAGLNTTIGERFALSTSIGKRDSTVDIYDEVFGDFDLQLISW